ncbi:DUF3604 domain-containing protein [Myxococcota bacterium]|nr:DUF3604 domain-containing protein [Myxococcota bacterium]
MAGAGGSSYLLWGDLHIHSSVSSDTDGASDTPDTLYVRARNSATLDFAAISDHDKGGIDDGSWVTDAIEPANDRHVDGTFVTLLGWEWTDADPEDAQTEGGHKIVYYLQGDGSSYCEDVNTACPTGATDPVEYFSNKNVPGDYKESCDLWEALAAQAADSDVDAQAITVPHHVATQGLPPRTAWDTVPDDCAGSPSPTRGLQSLVELFSDHGSSEGWNGASPLPIEDEAECDADPDRTVQAAQEYRWGDSSEEPHFLGVIASGDSHYGRPGQDPLPRVGENNTGAGTAGVGIKCGGGSGWRWREGGLAAVWVEAASRSAAIDRAAIFESLKRRRTYGTTGSRIQLTFYLTDDTGGSDTLIDQGGAPPSGATDYDDPEYDIAGASGHNTELNFTDICPGSGTLDTVRLFHGWDDAGTWRWDVRKTWTSADFDGAGCLVGKTLNLIVGGTVNAANLKSGKNVYYVKVKETDTKPIRVASGRNRLRLTPDGGSPSDCTLSTGSWLPAAYVTSGQLATDLEGCYSGLDFTVTYNADPLDPYRFVVSADDAFAMDGDSDAVVKATMAMLGFAQVDRAGALSHEGDDQVQSAANAEFAWSSPIWVDYVP